MRKNIISTLIVLTLINISCVDNSLQIDADYSDRTYLEYIPTSLRNNTDATIKPALLFILHGSGGKGRSMQSAIGMDELAEQNNFIVIYPDGINGRWDLDLSCFEEPFHEEDDYNFIDYLINEFEEKYNIDRSNVFVAGFSNGAFFSMALQTRLPGRFKGIISAAGLLYGEISNKLTSSPPVSVMMINGTSDSSVPWDPQETGECSLLSADNSISVWQYVNRTDSTPVVKNFEDKGDQYINVTRYSFYSQQNDTETSLVKVEGGGHSWYMYNEFNSSVEIVEFMKRQNALSSNITN